VSSRPDKARSYRHAPALPESRAELRRFFAEQPLNNVILISNHAIERYRYRFGPKLEMGEAKARLYAAMRERGQFSPFPPEWLYSASKKVKNLTSGNVGYIVVDDELAMPLRLNTMRSASTAQGRTPQPYVAVTCLYRAEDRSARESYEAAREGDEGRALLGAAGSTIK